MEAPSSEGKQPAPAKLSAAVAKQLHEHRIRSWAGAGCLPAQALTEALVRERKAARRHYPLLAGRGFKFRGRRRWPSLLEPHSSSFPRPMP